MEIFKANQQWASRPADERFPSLDALYKATKAYASTAVEAHVDFSSLRAQIAIDAPAFARPRAQPNPIPPLPPVTTATLPRKSKSELEVNRLS